MDKKITEIFNKVNPIGGWLKDEEMVGLIKVSLKIENGTILEVGTGLGKSTAIFALASPTSKIYTIDNMTARFHENMSVDEFKGRCVRHWDSVGVTDRIKLRIGDFRDWDWHKDIDLLFIEGKQLFTEAFDTFNKFNPFVKNGGYIVIRDYETNSIGHEHGKFVDEVLVKDRQYETHIEGQFVWAKKV